VVNKNSRRTTPTEARRRAILELVAGSDLSTQRQIVRALRRRGIEATQASVSRDVRQLGLVKAAGIYRLGAAAGPEARLRESVRSVAAVPPNLVVVRCDPGAAPRVGLALDQKQLPEVAGTVAGDDTVFVAVRSAEAGRRLARWLEAFVAATEEKAS
jgi:transcriptional regulator of arginine metabolism